MAAGRLTPSSSRSLTWPPRRGHRDLLGLPLHTGGDNEAGDDRWISGEHAAISWTDGAFLHFSLYQAKGEVTRSAQLGFNDDLAATHARLTAAGVPGDPSATARAAQGDTARYRESDGNAVGLTQARR